MPVPIPRWLVFVHRWLGIAGGLLFLAWFASGIVMMYARMPELPAEELARRALPLDIAAVRHGPADLAEIVGSEPARVQLTMFRARPVYRVGTARAGRAGTARARAGDVVFADTRQFLPTLDAETAVAVARELWPEHAATIRHDTRLTDADQWTMGVRAQMPMHRIAVGDPDDTFLYVTERTGEIVMRTTARERRWAYPGAILHWLYFAPFRRQAALWTQSIIWLSIAGCVMCVTGLIWGVSVVRRSPYAGLMKWHHYSGLIFGAASLTWVFSGLLSMGPWGWSPGTVPTRAQRERVAGGPLTIAPLTTEALRAAAAALAESVGRERLKAIDVDQFQGALYLNANRRSVSIAHPERGVFERFPDEAIERAARDAMPGVAIDDATWLHDYDSYYYARDRRAASLPVLRVRFADANRTWLYLDPHRGALLRKEERRSRIERWLYRGLHSLDFPFLYNRRPLWDAVVLVLSVGGIVLSATTLLPGWRRLRRHTRVLFKRVT
jgi:hypothetical protein